nr:immunoglobulin light chain junction region [Macaca mulatta]
CQQENNWSWTF